MDDLALITRADVLRAIDEVTASDPADPDHPDYLVLRGEVGYPVHPVMEHARRFAGLSPDDDEPLESRECALLLRGLGFEVTGDALPPLRFTSAATVGAEHARATWALAARERLLEVAATYGDSIDYRDLAGFVQRRSLVRSSAKASSWVGDVLGRVAHECQQRREPLLTSLVVDARGRVGASYATALHTLRGEEPTALDEHAAHERLECHRRFGAQLPPDGGVPVELVRETRPQPRRRAAPRPEPTAARAPRAPRPAGEPRTSRARATSGTRRTAEESVVAASQGAAATCPVHFTVIPPSGVCDFCE